PGTVLRLPMVYGPGDPEYRFFSRLKRMDDQRPVILLDEGTARWRGTRGFVENVAAAIALAAVDGHARGRIYNVGDAVAWSETEWTKELGRVVGWHGEVVAVSRHRLPAPLLLMGDVDTDQHWVVDTSRIRRELGYRDVISHEKAIGQTVDWLRSHPPSDLDPSRFDYAAEDTVLAQRAP
ncbi:MAG: NAD-dependent epimerase/dehydratase family protein, partial [Candidatus Dormibacteraceae bacterium]